MTDRPFEYDPSLVSWCARSRLAASIPTRKVAIDGHNEDETKFDEGGDEACRRLFELHAAHYGRPLHDDGANDAQVESESMTTRTNNGDAIRERFTTFVSSVVFVHEHNSARRLLDPTENTKPMHDVTLNRFSDLHSHELPLSDGLAHEQLDAIWGTPDERKTHTGTSKNMFTQLRDEQSIMEAAETLWSSPYHLHYRHHSFSTSTTKKHHNKKKKYHSDSITVPYQTKAPFDAFSPLQTKRIEKSGEELFVKQNKYFGGNNDTPSQEEDGDDVDSETSSFDSELNWSSENNPDGVNIVHPVMDQGACGSCWAISATGTVEASASRREAYDAFTSAVQDKHPTNKMYNDAVATARRAEQAAHSVCKLSVQELVDCDTEFDQGCTGGNPLLAFYFIHRYGLTSTERYPYIAAQDKCHLKRVADPIAYVESWGILTPNHEDNMELVLRYIGPLAVGLNGADPAFLAYKEGIFDSPNCDQDANHAMLITGYGEEVDQATGTKTRYWIARNSWGTGWGENGYVRVKRGSGKKGEKGVCGISRSPSVALGGALLQSVSQLRDRREFVGQTEPGLSQHMLEGGNKRCSFFGSEDNELCTDSFWHYYKGGILVIVAFLMIFLVMWRSGVRIARRRQRGYREVQDENERALRSRLPLLCSRDGRDSSRDCQIPESLVLCVENRFHTYGSQF